MQSYLETVQSNMETVQSYLETVQSNLETVFSIQKFIELDYNCLIIEVNYDRLKLLRVI